MDKFKQYADVVIQELVQVLTRIDDASVETALSMIEASKRIALGRTRGAGVEVLCHAANAFGQRCPLGDL